MSRMFKSITRTWNCYVGCYWDCQYCNAKKAAETRWKHVDRYKDGFKPHMVEKELTKTFKEGEFIFIAYMGDICFASLDEVRDIMARVRHFPKTRFLTCTKNPAMYNAWPRPLPDNLVIMTTLETNRDNKYSKAPIPFFRCQNFLAVDHPHKAVSIEPIMDFDLYPLIHWIKSINAEFIEVGADNYHNGLPEPSPEKLRQLLLHLRGVCPNVIEKDGLNRLKGGNLVKFGAAKCPKCQSANVEPKNDKLWHCNGCGIDFDAASVEVIPDEGKKKGGK